MSRKNLWKKLKLDYLYLFNDGFKVINNIRPLSASISIVQKLAVDVDMLRYIAENHFFDH